MTKIAGISIRGDERVLTCGKTGSGKTFAMRHMLTAYPRVIYLDSLARLDMEPSSGEEALETMNNNDEYQICIDDNETFETVVMNKFEEGGFIVYIDETYAICEPKKSVPPVINLLWTRGRGNGIGAWAATQRPAWLPLFLLSEAEHYFVFRLQLDEDRKRLSSLVGKSVLDLPTDKHGFNYYRPGDDIHIYKRSI